MAAAKTLHSGVSRKSRRKIPKSVTHGRVYIKSTFNNTIISLTDTTGVVITWAFSDQVGSKGPRKSAPLAVQLTVEAATRHTQEHGMEKVGVFVEGPGSDYEIAIRLLQAVGLKVGSTQSATPQAHNGAHPPKRRRV